MIGIELRGMSKLLLMEIGIYGLYLQEEDGERQELEQKILPFMLYQIHKQYLQLLPQPLEISEELHLEELVD